MELTKYQEEQLERARNANVGQEYEKAALYTVWAIGGILDALDFMWKGCMNNSIGKKLSGYIENSEKNLCKMIADLYEECNRLAKEGKIHQDNKQRVIERALKSEILQKMRIDGDWPSIKWIAAQLMFNEDYCPDIHPQTRKEVGKILFNLHKCKELPPRTATLMDDQKEYSKIPHIIKKRFAINIGLEQLLEKIPAMGNMSATNLEQQLEKLPITENLSIEDLKQLFEKLSITEELPVEDLEQLPEKISTSKTDDLTQLQAEYNNDGHNNIKRWNWGENS
jgi:hypothetical protein